MERIFWPYQDDDLVNSRWNNLELSNGRLLVTEINYAKLDQRETPRIHKNPKSHNIYKWSDLKEWIDALGLTVIGPRYKEKKGKQYRDPFVSTMYQRVEAHGRETDALRAELDAANAARDAAEKRLKWMTSKTPGLLSGHEILARAMPYSSIATVGVYFLIDKTEIVYIGQSKSDVFNRIRSHVNNQNKRFTHVFIYRAEVQYLDWIEKTYIQRFIPKYNVTFKPESAADGYDMNGTPRKLPYEALSRGLIDGQDIKIHDYTGNLVPASDDI